MPLTALHRFGDEDLNPDEVVIYRAHLSFVAFALSAFPWFLEILLSLVLLGFAFWYQDTIGFLRDNTVTIGVFVFFALVLGHGTYRFSLRLIDWLYDEDVITNQRVIDYNQKFLFAQEQSTAAMNDVTDMELIQNGFIRTFFDYGFLEVRTASSDTGQSSGRGLTLVDVKSPRKIQRLIDEVSQRVKTRMEIVPEEILKICGLHN